MLGVYDHLQVWLFITITRRTKTSCYTHGYSILQQRNTNYNKLKRKRSYREESRREQLQASSCPIQVESQSDQFSQTDVWPHIQVIANKMSWLSPWYIAWIISMKALTTQSPAPSRDQTDTARPKASGKQKQTFIINHIVTINYLGLPKVSGVHEHSYQAGESQDSDLSPRSHRRASPKELRRVGALGNPGMLSWNPLQHSL